MGYIYYRLWQSLLKVPTNDTPATNALILLGVVQSCNILVIAGVINHFYKLKYFYLDKQNGIICSAVIVVFCYIIDYFLLYKKRDLLAERYKNETKGKKIIGEILTFVYIIGSFSLVYVTSQIFPVR